MTLLELRNALSRLDLLDNTPVIMSDGEPVRTVIVDTDPADSTSVVILTDIDEDEL